MRVIHATPYTTVKQGGPSVVTPPLAEQLVAKGWEIDLVGQSWPGSEPVQWPALIATTLVPTTDSSGFGYAAHLSKVMQSKTAAADLLHSHGLWMYLSYLSDKVAHRLNKPHVVTVHGMLEQYILARSPTKKALVRTLFQDRLLKRASCIHALCEPEAQDIRALGFKSPIAIIPNGIRLENFAHLPPASTFFEEHPQLHEKKVLLFLSRIHPKKGLPHLVSAWGQLAKVYPQWHLVIAGPDTLGYKGEIEQLVAQLGIDRKVTFLGMVDGKKKLAALAAADGFVLPSFSEGFSMAILEALACRIPVLLTSGCHFPEAVSAGAAIEIAPDVSSTAMGLKQLMDMTDDERLAMGDKGHELIATRYTWDRIAADMAEVYNWCLSGGVVPSSIRVES